MENEREKVLWEELKKIQDSKPKGDSLLRLIRSLQRLQSSGPVAVGARSPSVERSGVVRYVTKYLRAIGSSSSSEMNSSNSMVLRHGGIELVITVQSGVLRCVQCGATMLSLLWVQHREGQCGGAGCEQVFILRPKQA
jgi:LysM repeat protein